MFIPKSIDEITQETIRVAECLPTWPCVAEVSEIADDCELTHADVYGELGVLDRIGVEIMHREGYALSDTCREDVHDWIRYQLGGIEHMPTRKRDEQVGMLASK